MVHHVVNSLYFSLTASDPSTPPTHPPPTVPFATTSISHYLNKLDFFRLFFDTMYSYLGFVERTATTTTTKHGGCAGLRAGGWMDEVDRFCRLSLLFVCFAVYLLFWGFCLLFVCLFVCCYKGDKKDWILLVSGKPSASSWTKYRRQSRCEIHSLLLLISLLYVVWTVLYSTVIFPFSFVFVCWWTMKMPHSLHIDIAWWMTWFRSSVQSLHETSWGSENPDFRSSVQNLHKTSWGSENQDFVCPSSVLYIT